MTRTREVTVIINGVKTQVVAQVIEKNFWFRLNKQVYCYEISDLSSSTTARKNKSLGGGAHLLSAPMPGKITKIFVTPGGLVEKNQAMLVMEAMKMEYTLKAEMTTAVESVNVKVGDQVALGHLLIKLKPEGKS